MNPDAGIMSWEQADQIMQDQRAEIARLREAIRRLADQDATLSVCNGGVTVTMDGTLTDAEREAIEIAIPFLPDGPYTEYDGTPRPDRRATLRALLERTK
jgi:hypothetical protein